MTTIIQHLSGRFISAYGSILILTFAGAAYIFGLYSNGIKTTLGYDQTTLNTISFFKDLGAYIIVHIGLLMEVAPTWVILVIGSIFNFVGYFVIWLSVTKRIAHPHVWQMCLYIVLASNSGGCANNSSIVTAVKNFPENRGVVIGVLKGFIGLGGAIMTQLFHTLYGNGNNGTGVILIISFVPSIAYFICAFFVRYYDTSNRQVNRDKKFFYDILYIALALATFMFVMIMLQKNFEFSKKAYAGTFAGFMVFVVLPLFLVVREEGTARKVKSDRNASTNLSELKIVAKESKVPSLTEDQSTTEMEQESCLKDALHPPNYGEDYSILQATLSIDMHIMMIATLCGVGGNLTTIDNLGQIGLSLGYQKKAISTFVSLLSIWQFLGRMLGGVFSDYVLEKFKWPRTAFLTFVLLLSCVGHLLIAFDAPYGLYVSSIIVGFCLGAQWTFVFALISELFGLKRYSTLNTYSSITAPLGSYLFNVRVAGHLYDREGLRQLAALGLTRKPGQALNCMGVKCYQLTYIIIFAATLFSALLSLVLVARTMKFYKGDLYKRFQARSQALQPTQEEIAQTAEKSHGRRS